MTGAFEKTGAAVSWLEVMPFSADSAKMSRMLAAEANNCRFVPVGIHALLHEQFVRSDMRYALYALFWTFCLSGFAALLVFGGVGSTWVTWRQHATADPELW